MPVRPNLIAVAAVALTAAMPAAANAATASIAGNTIVVTGEGTERDRITITSGGFAFDADGIVTGTLWRISGADPGPGCDEPGSGPGLALCGDGRAQGPTRSFDIDLGSGDDELTYDVRDDDSGDSPTGTIDLGPGRDEVESRATEAHTILGGDGNDEIELTSFAPRAPGSPPVAGELPDPATLDGGAGDDLLEVSGRSSADVLIGGPDRDTVSYLGRLASTPVTLSLDGVANDGRSGEGDDVRDDVETLIGTPGADTIDGDGNDQTIDGGLGTDDLDGQGGRDMLSFATRVTAVTANLATGTTSDVDTIAGFEDLRGGGGGDTLTGNDAVNRIEGGGAGDVLDGRLGADELVGDAGSDFATYESRPGPVSASLDGFANDPDGDTLGVENLRGTAAGDSLRGGAGPNVIEGLGGNDKIDGKGGNDTLRGDAGDDIIGPLRAQPVGGCFFVLGEGRVCEIDHFQSDPPADGVDTISGGTGNDTLASTDGVADNPVACGLGNDSVRVDLVDPDPTSCENVAEAPRDKHPVTALHTARVTKGAVRLTVACPRSKRCAGRVVLRSGKRTLGSARYRIAGRRSATVTVRLRKAPRRVTAVLVERGATRTVALRLR